MTEPAQKPPKQRDLSGPLHSHLGEAAKPEVVKDGYIPPRQGGAGSGRGGWRLEPESPGPAERPGAAEG